MKCPVFLCILAVLAASVGSRLAVAQTTQPAKVEVALAVVTEDRQKLIRATVTLGGKPVENVDVAFAVKRTFGDLSIGKDKTLDDGTAAVPFPSDLPGGEKGQLRVLATILGPAKYSTGRAQATFDGARVVLPDSNGLPRALWAPQAPIILIVTIAAIVVGVWLAHAYVAFQLFAISRRR